MRREEGLKRKRDREGVRQRSDTLHSDTLHRARPLVQRHRRRRRHELVPALARLLLTASSRHFRLAFPEPFPIPQCALRGARRRDAPATSNYSHASSGCAGNGVGAAGLAEILLARALAPHVDIGGEEAVCLETLSGDVSSDSNDAPVSPEVEHPENRDC